MKEKEKLLGCKAPRVKEPNEGKDRDPGMYDSCPYPHRFAFEILVPDER